jgi:hypothetical protein
MIFLNVYYLTIIRRLFAEVIIGTLFTIIAEPEGNNYFNIIS